MPRALKTDKFFIYAPIKRGRLKGRILLGVNNLTTKPSVQDLFDFLKEKGVDPSKVPLPPSFIVYTKP